MLKYIFVALWAIYSALCHSVVRRHDIADHYYKTDRPAYLIDMPHEGHGVLIAPQWVVTVAHVIFYDYRGKYLTIGGKDYQIEKMIIHPDYKPPTKSLLNGDAAPLMAFLKQRSDIALIKLSTPVFSHITAIEIYPSNDEVGQTVTVFGRGATGNGQSGEMIATKKTPIMRSFNNIIEQSNKQWLSYRFNSAPNALVLEGIHGSGDSGGAAIVYQYKRPLLIGLSSWQFYQGDLSQFKAGLYGTTAYQVRLSHYRTWIFKIINSTD